jgi:hypothetical protein
MQIKASFFYDASLRNWKRRMVFRVTPVCPLQDEFLSVNTFVRPESAFSIDSYVPEESGAESRKIDGTEDGSGSLTF